jgi:prophage antirepressor-like protein
MHALIDLNNCREYMTVSIGGKNHQIKLSGTVNDPYFCGRDVCEVLGYEAPLKALQRYVDNEDKNILSNVMVTDNHSLGRQLLSTQTMVTDNHSLGRQQYSFKESQMIFISETGLYSLILSSQAPFAKEFKKLVCKTILPSIRKYGSYQVESQLSQAMEQLAINEKSKKELQEKLENEKEARVKAEEQATLDHEARVRAERKAIRVNKFMRRVTVKERKLEWIYSPSANGA